MKLSEGLVHLLEASGRRWRVLLISAGKSRNQRGLEYPADTLKAAVQEGVFDGIPAKALRFDRIYAHLPRGLKQQFPQGFADVVVGGLHEAKWDEALQGVTATLELAEGATWFEPLLRLSQRLGGKLFGWSIDGDGKLREGSENVVDRILSVDSVDFVTAAARGGRTLEPLEEQLIESFAAEMTGGEPNAKGGIMKDRIRKLLERVRQRNAALLEGIDVEQLVENEDLDKALELLEAALKQPEPKPEPKPKPADTKPADDPVTRLREAADAERHRLLADIRLEESLSRADLPDECKATIRDRLLGNTPTEAAIQEAINGQVKLVQKLRGDGGATPGRIVTTLEGRDKLQVGFAKLLECSDLTDQEKAVPRLRGLQDLYIQVSGDHDLRGDFGHATRGLQEAMLASDTWSNIIQAVGTRRLQALYADLPNHAMMLASSTPDASDFKINEIADIGGFTSLQLVPEGHPVQPTALPGDQKVRRQIAIYASLLQITYQMVRNNDLGAIQRMMKLWAQAAVDTLEYVCVNQALLSNPTWADGSALFAAARGNLNTSINLVTDPWGVFQAAELMLKTTKKTNLKTGADKVELKRLGLKPHIMLCGPASYFNARAVLTTKERKSGGEFWNGSAAVEFQAEGNPYFESLGSSNERLLDNTQFSDTTTKAIVTADPARYECLEIGFLDGKKQPELVREAPNTGMNFTHFATAFRMSFIFGGVWVDPRTAVMFNTE